MLYIYFPINTFWLFISVASLSALYLWPCLQLGVFWCPLRGAIQETYFGQNQAKSDRKFELFVLQVPFLI